MGGRKRQICLECFTPRGGISSHLSEPDRGTSTGDAVGDEVGRADAAPVTVAVVDDFEVVVAGVAAMLVGHPEVQVVELAAGEPVQQRVDVALFDTFAQGEADTAGFDVIVDNANAGAVAVYTWQFAPELVDVALRRGVGGYLSKSLDGDQLASALRRIASGEVVVQGDDQAVATPARERAWPGQEHGLTEREAEVLALVTGGRSNAEIAEVLHVSPNTVKSYVRSAYRRIGVDSRSRAVLWGVDHGMRPPSRRLDDWRLAEH